MVLIQGGIVVRVEPGNIPASLKAERRWCVWQRFPTKDGNKFTKKPMRADKPSVGLSKTSSHQWQSFDVALETYEREKKIDGLGFICGGGFVAFDFDECCDEITREISPPVAEVVASLKSYTEYSPSGRGVRVFVLGSLPGKNIASKAQGYELYSEGAYVTITGQRVPGTPAELAQGGSVLRELYERAGKKPVVLKTTSRKGSELSELSDDELLAVAQASSSGHKIDELLAGQTSSYPTASEAELALANYLSFYAGPAGRSQVERLMRASGLMRDKFDERRGEQSYLSLTVGKAFAGRSEFYSSRREIRVSNKSISAFRNDVQTSERVTSLLDISTMTDIGLARRLVKESKSFLRYCREQKSWLSWTGKHWKIDDGLGAASICKHVSDALWSELAGLPADRRNSTLSFVKQSSSCRSIDAACKLARSEPGIAVSATELDRQDYLLNVQNGTLNLETAELLKHDPALLITHLAGVSFEPKANAPRWKKFIQEVTQGDTELAGFLQRSAGLALSADVSEHALWIHFGNGSNGKSTLLTILSELLGTYAGPAPLDMLLVKGRSKEQETQFAALAGLRLVTTIETDAGVRLSEATTKLLTGGDTVLARKLYEQPWPLVPSWKLHLAANHKPLVRGTDSGIWRRIKLIPWLAQFELEKQDKNLKDELRSELAGILNWCLVGFLDWRSAGLRSPATVTAASSDYRGECDILGQWMTECCTPKSERTSAMAEHGALYYSYRVWTEARNEPTMAATAFGLSLERLGYHSSRPSAGPHKFKKVRHGIGLLDSRLED